MTIFLIFIALTVSVILFFVMDLVRVVGLLQQAMQEEERRFSHLSQCLQTLNAKQTAILSSMNGKSSGEDEDDEDDQGNGEIGSQRRPLLHDDANYDNQSYIRNRKSPLNTDHISQEFVQSTDEGGGAGLDQNKEMANSEHQHQQQNGTENSGLGKLSVQWDKAGTGQNNAAYMDNAELSVHIGNGHGENGMDDLEGRMREEQERRDYLTRELCLSQSRLAQLCSKNLKIYHLQQEHRRLYGLNGEAVEQNLEELADHIQHSQNNQESRKSLSSLYKEKKLKDITETSNHVNILRQQAFQSVLNDILAGSDEAHSPGSTEPSPESGYNSSSSLKSPYSSAFQFCPASSHSFQISPQIHHHQQGQLQPNQQQQQIPKLAKPNELELHASRERILEQVRSRRASAPPNQHLQQNQPVENSPSPGPLKSPVEKTQRPLKSILKKRQPDSAFGGSLENGIGRNHENPNQQQHSRSSSCLLKKCLFGVRSSSYSDEGDSKELSAMTSQKQSDLRTLRYSTEARLNENSSGMASMPGVGQRPAQGQVSPVSQGPTRVSSVSQRQAQVSPVSHRPGQASPVSHRPGQASPVSHRPGQVSPVSHRPSQASLMPVMSQHPGPMQVQPVSTMSPRSGHPGSNEGSPGPYSPRVDFPSPVGNGGSSNGKQGDLPDVVMLKISDGSNQMQSSIGKVSSRVEKGQSAQEEPRKVKLMHEERSLSKEDAVGHIENDVFRNWDPRPLLRELYTVSYECRPEEKRQRFVNMEGKLEHLPMNIRAMVASETMWRTHYFRTKEGQLQWFEDPSDTLPFGEMALAGADIDVDKNAYIFTVKNPQEGQLLTVRYPPHLLDKWRSALLSHANISSCINTVIPVYPPIPHVDERIVVIEIGSCSIRAGLLTSEPSLPQSYFPSIACVSADDSIVPGFDALSPSIRHEGTIVRPIKPTQLAINRYRMDLEIVKHLFHNAFQDLQIDPRSYQVMLSVPQNAPVAMISDMMRALLADIGVQGVFVSRQPFLVLYAYDVTTGVVVDFGDRLNIVPVIDGYVVQSAIVSLPYGGHNVSEGLRTKLIERNWTPYSFMSEVEKYILRYVMEKTCYVAGDFEEEAEQYDKDPSQVDTQISIEQFQPTEEMPKGYNIDSSRFTSSEGIFKPKRWGFDIDGLHKLIYHAIQSSPLDSRRVLYRNIYLAGGASLIPGLVERLELELAPLVASSVQVRVRTSPWRDHAAYIGAQILAGGIQFQQQIIKDTEELEKFIRRLYTANF